MIDEQGSYRAAQIENYLNKAQQNLQTSYDWIIEAWDLAQKDYPATQFNVTNIKGGSYILLQHLIEEKENWRRYAESRRRDAHLANSERVQID